jgi:Sap, sulfolipid-1-addressing protein
MDSLLVSLVLVGLVIAVEPLPVIGFILVLSTSRGRANGVAFVLGWLATMVAIAAAVVALAGTWDPGGGGSKPQLGYGLQLAGGLALLVVWWVRRRRPAPFGPAEAPGWTRHLDRLRPPGAAFVGFLLQPWPLTAAAMGAILHADVGVTASIAAAAVFVAVSTSGLMGMLGYELLAPAGARARLDALRAWLESHRGPALTAVAGVAGAWLAIAGLVGLVGVA